MKNVIWDYHNPYEWLDRVATSALPPLIICCAISGGMQGKESNPNLPETPEEQAQQTYEAYRAGASMVHLHARDPQKWWDGSGDPEQYRLVNGAIRDKCPDIIINNTTGGSVGMTVEERLACLNANPEVATINMGPDMFKGKLKARPEPLIHPRPEMLIDDCMPVTYSEVVAFAEAMKERNIKPEMEVYHPGLYWPVWELIDKGLVEKPYLVQHVMGYLTSSYATPANLISLMNELPEGSIWEVAGLGPYQLPMITMAIVLGAQIVRVGMEDNVYRRRGQLLQNNREAVEQVLRIAAELNREIATPAQAREMLGLSQTPSSY